MNAMTLPSGQASDNAATAGAGNATGSALKVEGSKLPAWINSKEGPGALVMDVLRHGGEVTVLAPESLRTAVQGQLKAALKSHAVP